MATPINKIHVNNMTKISLNDRFTVMQSVAPPVLTTGNPALAGRRRQLQRNNNPGLGAPSPANRKFLDQLEKKHKIQTALKLKRRSLKTSAMQSPYQGRRFLGRRRRKVEQIAYHLGPNGRLIRSNTLSNIATMKADFLNSRIPAATRLRRSNSTANLSAIGQNGRRNSLGNSNMRRGGQRRRSLSRSRMNTMQGQDQRSRGQNLRRSNSRNNFPSGSGINQRGRSRSRSRNPNPSIQNNNNNNNNRMRSVSRNRRDSSNIRQRLPVQSRLGNKINNIVKNRINQNGRINKRGNIRNNKFAGGNNRGNGLRQGRMSRSRGRIATTAGRRGRSRSRGGTNSSQQLNGGGNGLSSRGGLNRNRGAIRGSNRGTNRGSNRGSNRGYRGNNRQSRTERGPLKREELDKELDAYMSSPKD